MTRTRFILLMKRCNERERLERITIKILSAKN